MRDTPGRPRIYLAGRLKRTDVHAAPEERTREVEKRSLPRARSGWVSLKPLHDSYRELSSSASFLHCRACGSYQSITAHSTYQNAGLCGFFPTDGPLHAKGPQTIREICPPREYRRISQKPPRPRNSALKPRGRSETRGSTDCGPDGARRYFFPISVARTKGARERPPAVFASSLIEKST